MKTKGVFSEVNGMEMKSEKSLSASKIDAPSPICSGIWPNEFGPTGSWRFPQQAVKIAAIFLVALLMLLPRVAAAHCDTLDGPVVVDAKAGLEKDDVTPVLKWVRKEDEAEIRRAFEKTMTVRKKGPEAGELADMYFFETLVRVHRAAEGAPYTGLKAAGADMGPAVAGADKALATGKVDSVVTLVSGDVAAGIRERFHHAFEAKKHADESVEAGREYVEAYVEFVHYVERIHNDAANSVAHHGKEEDAPAAVEHHH